MTEVSSCRQKHGPAIAVMSPLLSSTEFLKDERFCSNIAECPNKPEMLSEDEIDDLRKVLDNKILCGLMCCCAENPAQGPAGTNQHQLCVHQTLKAVNTALGGMSRYKSEYSFNMNENPPSPFMHREGGADTLEPSTSWLTRAIQEIPGFQGGKGLVRRPDIVIVRKPHRPPSTDNIARIVEMKFQGDLSNAEAERGYRRIVGGDADRFSVMQEGTSCKCGEDEDGGEGERMRESFTVSESQDDSVDWWAVSETVGMGVLTGVAAAATVAAILSPFDGPVLDAAGVTATGAAAARTAAAFGRIFRAAPAF